MPAGHSNQSCLLAGKGSRSPPKHAAGTKSSEPCRSGGTVGYGALCWNTTLRRVATRSEAIHSAIWIIPQPQRWTACLRWLCYGSGPLVELRVRTETRAFGRVPAWLNWRGLVLFSMAAPQLFVAAGLCRGNSAKSQVERVRQGRLRPGLRVNTCHVLAVRQGWPCNSARRPRKPACVTVLVTKRRTEQRFVGGRGRREFTSALLLLGDDRSPAGE